MLLLPELLPEPTVDGAEGEAEALAARLATALGAAYGLRAGDAVHLATVVATGADRFITNNASDFSKDITEVDVTYPDELPAP